jgi:tetratricopeptide (TPR) repeat protein
VKSVVNREGEDSPAFGANEISGQVFGASLQARSIHGDIKIELGRGAPPPVPAQLGPVPGVFVDRVAELAELDRLADMGRGARHSPLLIVISGLGGVGKSSLALQWLHQIRDRFDDGQLYADLRGFHAMRGASVQAVLERFLRALGIAPEHVPASLDEQVTLYRSATTGRRLIVMLDNAASAAEVRAFLPVSPHSLVLVTTRLRLTSLVLDGAQFLELGPLSQEAAVQLLDRVLGAERIAAEPEEARLLTALCGCLPIAVGASAAHLAMRPQWSIGRLVRELGDTRHRLSVLSTRTDISIQAAFDVSYSVLSPGEARLYRTLGLYPGENFTLGVAIAAGDVAPHEAAELMDDLVGASLIEDKGGDRYRFHDLLHLHARQKAMDLDPPEDRRSAVARMATWFLHAAVQADQVVIPGRWHLGPSYDLLRDRPSAFPGPAAALDWLESELPNLRAVMVLTHEMGLHDLTWQLCESLWGLFLNRKHYADWLSTHEMGLAAARAAGDPLAESRMLLAAARACRELGRYQKAIELCQVAAEVERAQGHAIGEAAALSGLGSAYLGLGRADEAIEHFEMAMLVHQRLGRRRGVGRMLRRLGEARRDAGRYDQAVADLDRALAAFVELGDPYNQVGTLASLGQTHVLAGRPRAAIETTRRALVIAEEIGARHEEARVRVILADALTALGRETEARDHLHRALSVFTELVSPRADDVRRRLDRLSSAPPPEA